MIGASDILDNMLSKFSSLQDALDNFAVQAMNDPEFMEWLIEANQREMYEGRRADGTEIEKIPRGKQKNKGYEFSTIYGTKHFEGKIKKGQVYDRVTLRDTNEFYSGEKVQAEGQELDFIDTDPKTEDLLATWGGVLGITPDNIEAFIAYIKPSFVDFATEYFNQ